VQVVDVGPGAFPDARVSTAIVLLTAGQAGARYFELGPSRDEALAALAHSPALAALGPALSPAPPDHPLRPVPALPPELAHEVCPVTDVLQRWLTPHKTGFDALLVDPDPAALWDRLSHVRGGADLPGFEAPRLARKLEVVRAWAQDHPSFPVRAKLLPYLRYNPRAARFAAPEAQWQHVYFEPRIATLFNHAFKGTVGRFRPHRAKPQLLFNTFEQPLFAMVVERPGVLHLYQHARFAPLRVPQGFWRARDEKVEHPDRGPPTLNLTPAWQARAALLRAPDDVFHLLAGIFQSALTQRLFGPVFGRRHPLPIKRFDAPLAPVAQRIADRARLLAAIEARGAGEVRGEPPSEPLRHLSDDVCRLYLGEDLPAEALRRTELWQATQRP